MHKRNEAKNSAHDRSRTPNLGACVDADFDWAHRQRLKIFGRVVTEKTKRLASGAPAHDVTMRWIVRWCPKKEEPSVGKFKGGYI